MEKLMDIANPTPEEARMLESHSRPIMLVKKKSGKNLESLAPGIDTIGAMLPYSPMHHLFFRHYAGKGVIMTSANASGSPMLTENDEVMALGADAYLLHDRPIINRTDDTVVKLVAGRTAFIRKSRGMVPDPIHINFKESIIALGGEMNITVAITKNGKLMQSQYLGNARDYDVYQYLKRAARHLMGMSNLESADHIAVDMHPKFVTRHFGKELAEEHGCGIVEVQHHWAHAASLMLDAEIEEPGIFLALDGTGYGTDGAAWGGEVLYAAYEGFERIGHLAEVPLIGGEKAIHEPERIAWAYLKKAGNEPEMFSSMENRLFSKLMRKSPGTTSMGRYLDAVSALLGICRKRTYDGEPAMKLERLLAGGRRKFELDAPIIEKDGKMIIGVEQTFAQLAELKKGSAGDKAVSAVLPVLDSLMDVAVRGCEKKGADYIGLTGGVSYNAPIAEYLANAIEKAGFRAVLHDRLPNGDGGVSAGQCMIAHHSSI